jgi:hypothetical protein
VVIRWVKRRLKAGLVTGQAWARVKVALRPVFTHSPGGVAFSPDGRLRVAD